MTDIDIKALIKLLHFYSSTGTGADAVMLRAADALEALQSDVERVVGEMGDACGYAERLAVSLWEQHWRNDAPQWSPLTGDLIGILTQIDNSTAGLRKILSDDAEAVLEACQAKREADGDYLRESINHYKDRAEKAEADVAFLVESVEKHVAAGIRLGERAEKAEEERDAALFDKAVAGGKVRVARNAALEEAAQVAENNDYWPREGEEIAVAIRALAGDKP